MGQSKLVTLQYFYFFGTLGFMQFIESTPVAEVLDKDVDGSIQVRKLNVK